MTTKSYLVKRAHKGDKIYKEGDVRKAQPGEVDHLVARGVLEEKRAEETPKSGKKAAPAPKNKAAPEVENKAGPASEADDT